MKIKSVLTVRRAVGAVSLLLIFLLLLSTMPACKNGGGSDVTEPGTTAVAPLVLNPAGKMLYKLVRPDDCPDSLKSAFSDLGAALDSLLGTHADITTDWVKRDEPQPVANDDYEILVGQTNRAESSEALSRLGGVTGYVICITEHKIVIVGSDEFQSANAINAFTAVLTFTSGTGELTLPADFACTYILGADGSVPHTIATKYSMVYATGSERVAAAASQLRSAIQNVVGGAPAISGVSPTGDAVSSDAAEILIGDTDRAESRSIADLKCQDYVIKYSGNKIVIKGGSPAATVQALYRFGELFESDTLPKLDTDYVLIYRFSEVRSDSLMYSAADFTPAWAGSFTVPEWMFDIDEKAYSVTCTDGRVLSDAHRGDTDNYPENSAAAIYSAALIGADCIEIDIRLTRDGVPVLLHDETLKRTTDWSVKAGKNGLPSSVDVVDWTYAELMELNLLFDGKTTEHKFCTLYEAVALAGGRSFLHMDDKAASLDLNTDVYPLAVEFNAKKSFFYYYGRDKVAQWVQLDTSDSEYKDYVEKITSYLAMPGHKLAKRDFEALTTYGDAPAAWKGTAAAGIPMLFTNNIVAMQKFIAENYTAGKP